MAFGGEESGPNRKAYMEHLLANVQLPSEYSMANVQPDQFTLSMNLLGSEKRRKIRGTTDVVIAKVADVDNKAVRQNLEALLELKTPKDMKIKDYNLQAICKHVAASCLTMNPDRALVTVLTDLNTRWTFFWFAKDAANCNSIALKKLELPHDDETSAGLAKYLLDNLFHTSNDNLLPLTFVDRLPFHSVKAAMFDKVSQYPPSSSGSPNLSDGNASSSYGNANGSPEMGLAQFLSRFAHPNSRDVANELDLLDMVDESEQYKIVRSFVARHIVPNMTGREL